MTPLQNARCCTAGAPHLLSLGTGSPPGCAAVGKGGRATAVGGQRLGAPPRCCCCSIGLLSRDRGLGGKHLPLPLLPPCAPLQTVLLVVQAGLDVRETKCISRALQGYSSRGAVCQDAERNREKENAACEVVGRALKTTPNDFRLARRAFRSPELMLTRGGGSVRFSSAQDKRGAGWEAAAPPIAAPWGPPGPRVLSVCFLAGRTCRGPAATGTGTRRSWATSPRISCASCPSRLPAPR